MMAPLPRTNLVHPVAGITIFGHAELASPDTDEVRLADGFAEQLIRLRVEYGLPMKVNSCCRSRERNAEVNGHPRSLHLMDSGHGINGTAAIDIARPPNGAAGAWRLLSVAYRLGWSVGHGTTFLHFDRRDLAGLPPGDFVY